MRIKLVFDSSFVTFLIIGVVNTLIGLTITYTCYDIIGLGYWTSSALDYILVSILSYFLNKHFTFHYGNTDFKSILRFALNIIVCYFLAFSIARPCSELFLENVGFRISKSIIENLSLLLGTIIFTILNYLGQRLFAFKQ